MLKEKGEQHTHTVNVYCNDDGKGMDMLQVQNAYLSENLDRIEILREYMTHVNNEMRAQMRAMHGALNHVEHELNHLFGDSSKAYIISDIGLLHKSVLSQIATEMRTGTCLAFARDYAREVNSRLTKIHSKVSVSESSIADGIARAVKTFFTLKADEVFAKSIGRVNKIIAGINQGTMSVDMFKTQEICAELAQDVRTEFVNLMAQIRDEHYMRVLQSTSSKAEEDEILTIAADLYFSNKIDVDAFLYIVSSVLKESQPIMDHLIYNAANVISEHLTDRLNQIIGVYDDICLKRKLAQTQAVDEAIANAQIAAQFAAEHASYEQLQPHTQVSAESAHLPKDEDSVLKSSHSRHYLSQELPDQDTHSTRTSA